MGSGSLIVHVVLHKIIFVRFGIMGSNSLEWDHFIVLHGFIWSNWDHLFLNRVIYVIGEMVWSCMGSSGFVWDDVVLHEITVVLNVMKRGYLSLYNVTLNHLFPGKMYLEL